MKIIYDTATYSSNNITSVSATNTDGSFPASNLLNDYTNYVWKATTNTSVITADVSAGCAVALFNTNATSITLTGHSDEHFIEGLNYGPTGRYWGEYTQNNSAHQVVLTLSTSKSSILYAGILRAGNVSSYRDPAPGHTESSVDTSIEIESDNGVDYFRRRYVVRTFSNLNVIETRANAWLAKMVVFDSLGPKPVAIKLFSSPIDANFVIFARRASPVQLTHIAPAWTGITFDLKEVV
jgi:hypothetical protein